MKSDRLLEGYKDAASTENVAVGLSTGCFGYNKICPLGKSEAALAGAERVVLGGYPGQDVKEDQSKILPSFVVGKPCINTPSIASEGYVSFPGQILDGFSGGPVIALDGPCKGKIIGVLSGYQLNCAVIAEVRWNAAKREIVYREDTDYVPF